MTTPTPDRLTPIVRIDGLPDPYWPNEPTWIEVGAGGIAITGGSSVTSALDLDAAGWKALSDAAGRMAREREGQ